MGVFSAEEDRLLLSPKQGLERTFDEQKWGLVAKAMSRKRKGRAEGPSYSVSLVSRHPRGG